MADQYPMTPRGCVLLKEELKLRKEVERHKIIQAIEEARAHGDLSENAEYAAAKEAQSHNEGRIGKLEEMIALANVIDPTTLGGSKISFGATVTLLDADTSEIMVFAIVGESEADIKQGRLSIAAPLARALIGRAVGDSIHLHTPRGEKEYEVMKIQFVAISSY